MAKEETVGVKRKEQGRKVKRRKEDKKETI